MGAQDAVQSDLVADLRSICHGVVTVGAVSIVNTVNIQGVGAVGDVHVAIHIAVDLGNSTGDVNLIGGASGADVGSNVDSGLDGNQLILVLNTVLSAGLCSVGSVDSNNGQSSLVSLGQFQVSAVGTLTGIESDGLAVQNVDQDVAGVGSQNIPDMALSGSFLGNVEGVVVALQVDVTAVAVLQGHAALNIGDGDDVGGDEAGSSAALDDNIVGVNSAVVEGLSQSSEALAVDSHNIGAILQGSGGAGSLGNGVLQNDASGVAIGISDGSGQLEVVSLCGVVLDVDGDRVGAINDLDHLGVVDGPGNGVGTVVGGDSLHQGEVDGDLASVFQIHALDIVSSLLDSSLSIHSLSGSIVAASKHAQAHCQQQSDCNNLLHV